MTAVVFTTFIAVFAALFPVINPLGDGPIFLNMVSNCSEPVKRKLALSVSINCFFILLGSMLIGPQLLLFFGISLPALKIAGGLVVTVMGWNLLNQKSPSPSDKSDSSGITDQTASSSAFFPLAMPLTVGPGSIATAISLVAGHIDHQGFDLIKAIPAMTGALLALIALSIVIYYVYRESSGLQRLLGVNGTNVLARLFAFILLAIGVQILLGGIEGFSGEIFKSLSTH
jgi:multiple antibiotic resistance protein